MRRVGTVARGIRTPIIKEGDDLVKIVVDSVLKAAEIENFVIKNRDIIGVTEAVLAISEKNYATVDQIAFDISRKFPKGVTGVVFPTPVSRNRFGNILKGIARGSKKIYLQFSFPHDEVGNSLFDENLLEKHNISVTDKIDEKKYVEIFGSETHIFTGINYYEYFKELVENEGCEIEFIFSNDPLEILNYTKCVLVASVHSRFKIKKLFSGKTEILFGLDDILNESVKNSGYHEKYGLLGSNKSTEEKVKLFPRTGETFVNAVQKEIYNKTKKEVEVLIYGDGAFRDPVGHIWELADPVVSPAYTAGLIGTPNELKLKYLSDNKFNELRGEELTQAIKEEIKHKSKDLKAKAESQGTTPRQLTDLIGSLCDLISGSGDKGTPIVYIQGYFDNYAD
ncbi:MAG: F420-0--gamma-glutamyl ligase [Methanosarcinaceae archaeon]|nr:F420-0--gamma-glutamyl ligase [Methanosarcinaceae archaeon]